MAKARILLTGHLGYIGSVMTRELAKAGYGVVGYDTGYFEDCLIAPPPPAVPQIKKDIRKAEASDLAGIDAVIHLAALSNDPLGELDPRLTEEINLAATIRLAELAKKSGVGRFLFASSQSLYGVAKTGEELDEDTSPKSPLTAYAKTKWEAEIALKKLERSGFTSVFLRPSTVFGPSPRLRCDIVFNNLLACAFTTGKIEIKSDGTPWRPVIHIQDVCQAFLAALTAEREKVAGEAFNVGIRNGNYTVRELALAAQKAVPRSELVFTGEHGTDARTYRVSFRKIFDRLGDSYRPAHDLDSGGRELADFFRQTKFSEPHFRGPSCLRLKKLQNLLRERRIDEKLFWRA